MADSHSSTQICVLTGAGNHEPWKRQLKGYLYSIEGEDLLDATKEAAVSSATRRKAWGYFLRSIGVDQQSLIASFAHGELYKAYAAIEMEYNSQSHAMVKTLVKELMSAQQGDTALHIYKNKINMLVIKLQNACTEQSLDLAEVLGTMSLQDGLHPRYADLQTMLSLLPPTTLAKAMIQVSSAVEQFDLHKSPSSAERGSAHKTTSESAAIAALEQKVAALAANAAAAKGGGSRGDRSFRPPPTVICSGCNQLAYHGPDKCWILHPELKQAQKPAGAKSATAWGAREVACASQVHSHTDAAKSTVRFELDSAAFPSYVHTAEGVTDIDASKVLKVSLAAADCYSTTVGKGVFGGGKFDVHIAPTFAGNLLSLAQMVGMGKAIHLTPTRCYMVHEDRTETDIISTGTGFFMDISIGPADKVASPILNSSTSISNSNPIDRSNVGQANKITSENTKMMIVRAHILLGCPCAEQLYTAVTGGHIVDLGIPVATLTLSDCDIQCVYCIRGKSDTRPHYSSKGRRRHLVIAATTSPGAGVPAVQSGAAPPLPMYAHTCADTKGPIEVTTYGGNRYAHIFVDAWSKEGAVFLTKQKSDFLSSLRKYEGSIIRPTGRTLRKLRIMNTFRTDNGSWGKNAAVTNFLEEKGIKQQFTSRYSSASNGRAERRIGHIENKAKCLMASSGFSKPAWGELYLHANLLINILPTKSNPGNLSAYQMKYNKPYSAKRMHPTGTRCYVHVPKSLRKSLDDQGEPGRLLNYSADSNCYRILMDGPGYGHIMEVQVMESDDVTFLEENWLLKLAQANHPPIVSADITPPVPSIPPGFAAIETPVEISSTPALPTAPIAIVVAEENLLAVVGVADDREGFDEPNQLQQDDGFEHVILPDADVAEEVENAVILHTIANSRTPRIRNTSWIQRNPEYSARSAQSKAQSIRSKITANIGYARKAKSITQAEAKKDPRLVASMEEHWNELIDNGRVEIVDKPEGAPELGNTWAHKIKLDNDGNFVRAKSRLCPWGWQQRAGIDYDPDETAAPTVSLAVIMLILILTVIRRMHSAVVDVVGAFNIPIMKEEVYMRFPAGIPRPPGKTLRMISSLNGTKQGGYNWYIMANKFMMEDTGFSRCSYDPCLYWKWIDTNLLIVILYVDDFRVIGDVRRDVDTFTAAFTAKFPAKIDPPGPYLGMQITHDMEAGILTVSMEKSIDNMLTKYNMSDCNPSSTPAEAGTKLLSPTAGAIDLEAQGFPYDELVGDLVWLARTGRPDILYPVNQCTAHLKNYDSSHVTAAKRVLRYLKGTKSMLRTFCRPADGSRDLLLRAYSDSDFANEPEENAAPMRSLTGMVIYAVGAGVIDCTSKLQDTIAHFTGDAEYRAAAHTGRNLEFFRNVLEEIGLPQEGATIIHEDNEACITMTKTVLCSSKTRHIKREHHYIREQVAAKEIKLLYCPTKEMLADMFTKALPRDQFIYLRDMLLSGLGLLR